VAEKKEGQDKKPKGVFNWFKCVFNKLRDSYNSLSSRKKVYYVTLILLVTLTNFIYFLALDFRESHNDKIFFYYGLKFFHLSIIYLILFIKEDSNSVGVFTNMLKGTLDFLIFLALFFLLYTDFYVKINSDYLYNTKSDTFIKINNDLHMLSFLDLYKGKDAFEEKYIGIKTNLKSERKIRLNGQSYIQKVVVNLTPNRVLVDNPTKMSIIYPTIKTKINSIGNNLSIKMVKNIVKEVFSKYFPTLKEDN
jgi:hypothetical protein